MHLKHAITRGTAMGPTPPDRIGDSGEHSNLRLGFPRGRLRQGASGHKGGPGDAGGMVKRQGGGGRKSEKGKRNIIKNINLHGDRLLLELVG